MHSGTVKGREASLVNIESVRIVRILLLEDYPVHADLIRETLAADGVVCELVRAETREDFLIALQQGGFDVVLADYSLPRFDGLTALALAQEKYPEIPFILVSGKLGEEAAIDSLKSGATDYVLKHRLTRLAPAVRRAVEEAAERKARRRAEAALRCAYDDLEKRVQQRTAELTLLNETLRVEIAERKRLKIILQQERDLLEVTLASIADAVIATDANALVQFLNPVAEALTGWAAQEAVGRHINEVFCLVERSTRVVAENPVARVLREKAVIGLGEYATLLNRDGREIPIATSGAPIRGKNGDMQGAVVVFHDVTERQQTEAALLRAKEAAEAADRTKSEFLATMSHELRTPLNVLLGYSDLLAESQLGSLTDIQKDAVERMRRNARELYELIAAVLDLSRLEAGRLPLAVEEVQIAELIEELRSESREAKKWAGVEFVWQIEAPLIRVYTDRGKLKVILRNLIGNAAKFTPNGRITVTARRLAEGVEVSVADTGIGIPKEALPLIFEPFHQVENSLTPLSGGTGLGLHIVKRLLDLLDGKIAADSNVGSGSTFRVWIPVHRHAFSEQKGT
jgi:PAS domain S-box-containing protein